MFSAILPSYNHRTFLFECIRSATQSQLVTEVLIVDDGSTDGSPELIARLASSDPKVRVIPNVNENRGAHVRLNELTAAATNQWIAVLNTDDLFVAGRFHALAPLIKRSKAELFIGDLVLIDDNGRRLGFRNAFADNEFPWPSGWDIDEMVATGQYASLLMLQNLAGTTTNMVFSRDLHARIGGFKDYRYSHDWDFILRASMRPGGICYVPTMLSKYRLHASNTIKEDRLRVVRDVRRMFRNAIADNPKIQAEPGLLAIMRFNRYLSAEGSCLLTFVAQDKIALELLRLRVGDERLGFDIVGPNDMDPGLSEYVCHIDPIAAGLLASGDIESLVLALSVRNYDFLSVGLGVASWEGEDPSSYGVIRVERRRSDGENTRGRQLSLRGISSGLIFGASKVDGSCDRSKCDNALGPWQAPVAAMPQARMLKGKDVPTVFILPAFLAVGGVERLILDTVRLLSKEYEFIIVNTEPLRPEQGSMHLEFKEYRIFDLPELVREKDTLSALQLLNDWFEPDLVWICNGAPWQVAHALEIRNIFLDVPIVDQMAYDHKEGWIQALADEGVRQSDRFVAINKKIRDAMISEFHVRQSSIDLVYHGTDLSRFTGHRVDDDSKRVSKESLGLPPEKQVFGMVGRLHVQKRPLDLIELAKASPDDVFIWVGLGELEEKFRAAATSVANVRLIPAQSDLIPIYKSLDGLIVFSEYEGLPLVLLEALAMGLPILSTDVGAIAEVLQEFGAGRLYGPPGDIASLTDAFNSFKSDLSALQKAARTKASQAKRMFSSDRMVADYNQCFQRAIAEKRLMPPSPREIVAALPAMSPSAIR